MSRWGRTRTRTWTLCRRWRCWSTWPAWRPPSSSSAASARWTPGHTAAVCLSKYIYISIIYYLLSNEVVAFLRRRGSVCWAATELSPRPLLLWRRRRKIVPVNKDQEMINNVKQWWVHAFWKYINHMWTKMWTRYTCHVWVMMWVSGVSQNTVNHYIRTLVCRGLSVRHCQFINCKYLSLI